MHFFSSKSSSPIVFIQVHIFDINICNKIIYVARCLENWASLNMIFHNLINLSYYERWTRKLKWFYVYFFHFFWPKALAEVIKYSQKFYPTYFSLSTLPVTWVGGG